MRMGVVLWLLAMGIQLPGHAASPSLGDRCSAYLERLHAENELLDEAKIYAEIEELHSLALADYRWWQFKKISTHNKKMVALLKEHLIHLAKEFNRVYGTEGGLKASVVVPQNIYLPSKYHIRFWLDPQAKVRPTFRTPLERLMWITLQRDPSTIIEYRPFASDYRVAQATYDDDTNTIRIGEKSLVHVDFVPGEFLHEDTHREISKSNGDELTNGFHLFAGSISGNDEWVRSGYLDNKFLSVSELQTFWVSIKANGYNLRQILKRRVIANYTEAELRHDLTQEISYSIKYLQQYQAILYELNTILRSARDLLKQPTTLKGYNLTEGRTLNFNFAVPQDSDKNVEALQVSLGITLPETLAANFSLKDYAIADIAKRQTITRRRSAYVNLRLAILEAKYGVDKVLRSANAQTPPNEFGTQELFNIAETLAK